LARLVLTRSCSKTFFVYANPGPTLLSAASRKVHSRRGAFDLALPLISLSGIAMVEPRKGGPTTLVFNLSRPVVAADGVLDASEFVLSNADFVSAAVADSTIVLNLAGIRNGTLVRAGLRSLVDSGGLGLRGNTTVFVRALEGDVGGDRFVGVPDLLAVRRRLLRRTGTTDFLYDVDCDGVVSAADLVAVRSGGLPSSRRSCFNRESPQRAARLRRRTGGDTANATRRHAFAPALGSL
jgi:hypothetical protein